MKVKLEVIINSKTAFQELLKEKLPIKLAYKIKDTLKLLEPKFQTYEELRSEMIIEKYGEKEKDGENWKVKKSMTKEFFVELSELLSEDVDLNIEKIKLPDETKITPENAYLLEWLIETE